MAVPNIAAAKRAGLPVDLDRLAREGDAWLTPEDRYALKTWGVCAQLQKNVFMVRVRIPGGVLTTDQARSLARIARRNGPDWLHLTTRQNIELHWVDDRRVPSVIADLERYGLSTRSACGHTLRNVMCSEVAGVGLDEPFDCFPDARLVSDAIVARSATLNCELPSRVNISFGGSPRCRDDALINDAGFVSVVVDGEPGYELWAGGSLGKAPALAVLLAPFIPRRDAVAAAVALIDVFVRHGDLEKPAKGRMKFAIAALGADRFRECWHDAFVEARAFPTGDVPDVELFADAARADVLSAMPPGGWSAGVRPQRTPGLALLDIDIPLGDTCGSELELLANLADRYADGTLTITRDQDIMLRNVAHEAVPAIRNAIGERGVYFLGEGHVARVRACTGSAVCALGITNAPQTGNGLLASPGLGRNSALRVHVSGCPNSCAQHQAGDIGLAGGKVHVNGAVRDGYQIYLGANLAAREIGEVVGRVGADDVPAALEAVVGVWEALRHAGETLDATVRRVGLDAITAHVTATLAERFATGPELEATPAPVA